MLNKLVLGTVQLGLPYGINNNLGQPPEKDAFEILEYAFHSGVTTLDTANAYGSALTIIGKYHRQSRQKFNLISKFHVKSHNIKGDVRNELAICDIDCFDAYLFHSFVDFENTGEELKNELKDLKAEKLINRLGVSVYTNEQFSKAIDSSIIDIIQFPYNLLDNSFHRGKLISEAKSAGKELHVRSVFLQGLFFMERKNLPEKLKPLLPYLTRLDQIVAEGNIDIKRVALMYAIQNDSIDKILMGIDSLKQLKSNVEELKQENRIPEQLIRLIDEIRVTEVELLNPANWK